MRRGVADADTPAELARFEAQKLAFAPLMFQAMRAMRDTGVLESLQNVGESGTTAEVIAAERNLPLYAAEILLEAGYAAGLCRYREPKFVITKMGVYWLKDPMTRANAEFCHHVCYEGAFHLGEALRTGLPAGLRALGPWPTIYEGLTELPREVQDAWLRFDHYYSDAAFEACLPRVLAGAASVVDIGGNTGRFASLCLRARPDLKITLVDLPQQLALAERALARDGAGDGPRADVSFAPVNLLDPNDALPRGADVYWMSQVLDCFSAPQIVSILRRVHDAMGPSSRAYILEPFWDKQRYEPARYCVIATSLYFACMANGNSRMYHSGVFDRLVTESGLRIIDATYDVGLAHSLLSCARS